MKVRLSALFVLACIAMTTLAHASNRPPTALPGQEDVVKQSMTPCPGGMEYILPGEYHFCAATRDFWRGKRNSAVDHLETAAEWASKPAQYALGVMYFNGDQLPQDRPLGLAWLALAAERHDPVYESSFISAYRHASLEERQQANVHWKALRDTYADKVAAVRAKRHFDLRTHAIEAAINFSGWLTIPAMTPGEASTGPMVGYNMAALERYFQQRGEAYFRGLDGTTVAGGERRVLVPVGQLADVPGS